MWGLRGQGLHKGVARDAAAGGEVWARARGVALPLVEGL